MMMKDRFLISTVSSFFIVLVTFGTIILFAKSAAAQEDTNLVKMCLFYDSISGHARSDPILNQECPSDHVHTFYGPNNFHPNTSYDTLRNTKPYQSTSPFLENQSLYWHPSIYRVMWKDGKKEYRRVSKIEMSPYYRWKRNTTPETVEFPEQFRMIAKSNAQNAGGDNVLEDALFMECCDMVNGEEDCVFYEGRTTIFFPKRKCDFFSIAFAMPTCWDTSKGVGLDDPYSHVAYTTNGLVGGPCPAGYNKRIPQVQVFIRIPNYQGGIYQLADDSNIFHVDFMNGWKPGTLTELMNKCEVSGKPGYNPPCDCDHLLTPVNKPGGVVCDEDVKKYILNEETKVISTLPRGTCQGAALIEKSWDAITPFTCGADCSDSKLAVLNKVDGQQQEFTCNDLKDPSNADFCNNRSNKSHCPVTCKAKYYCDKNSKKRFILVENDQRITCSMVIKRKWKWCKYENMCDTCRAACSKHQHLCNTQRNVFNVLEST